MAAPAAAQPPPPLLVRMNEAEVKTTMPLPRAIQLVMAIVWSRSKSSTTTIPSTKTIGDLPGVHRYRFIMWIHFVFPPSMHIAAAASLIYAILCDDSKGGGRELISGAGGFCFVAILVVAVFVYNAVLAAAAGHLGLFAPRTPVAAWEAFYKGAYYEGMGFILMLISIGVGLLGLVDQAWPLPLLVAWICLLGLLVASIVAFWLCLLRTYVDGGGERREKNSCGEAVIDGLAYLYCRLLYEYAVRLHPGKVTVADADAGMQQHLLDADVAVV